MGISFKKAWQRLIIMIGGVTVNLILGILIYVLVVFSYGEDKLSPVDLKAGISVHPYLKKYGIESGDNILKINDEKIDNVLESNIIVLLRDGRKLEIEKANGGKKTIKLPKTIDYELFEKGALPAFSPRVLGVEIGEVDPASPAFKVGLQKGDKIISVDSTKIVYYDDFQSAVFNSKGKEIDFQLLRKNDTLSKKIKIAASGKYEGKFGFSSTNNGEIIDYKQIKHVEYSFLESIRRGFHKGTNTVGDYAAQLKFLFTKKGASSIGGFGSIGKMFPSTWNWEVFWLNTAFISIVLAFMNILPIPALDGGHVVFLLYEIITGKEAPQKVLEYAQYVGFILLLALLLYANGNDIYGYFFR